MESKTPTKKSKLIQYNKEIVDRLLECTTYESLMKLLLELELNKVQLIPNNLFKAFEKRNHNEQFMKLFGNKFTNEFDYNQALIGFTKLISTQFNSIKPSKQICIDIISTIIMCRTADSELCAPFAIHGSTKRFIYDSWKGIPIEVLRHYITNTNLIGLNDEIPLYLKELDSELDSLESNEENSNIKQNEIIDRMIEYIWRFNIFEIDIDWLRITKRLLELTQFNRVKQVLSHNKHLIPEIINYILIDKNNMKQANKLIEEYSLDPKNFQYNSPEKFQKELIWMMHSKNSFYDGTKKSMPIWKAEDVFSGNDEALMQLIQKLISKGTPTNLLDAKLLAVRNNLENLLLEEYRNAIQNIEPKQYLSDEIDLNSNEIIYKKFGPLSTPESEYMKIPEEVEIVWIDNEESIKDMAKTLKLDKSEESPFSWEECPLIVGCDCEWRPSFGGVNPKGVAILQLCALNFVFLIDMIKLSNSEYLDEVLSTLFTKDDTKVIAMDFQNDIKEITMRSKSFTFTSKLNNLYDIGSIYCTLNNMKLKCSLTKITQHIIGKGICKVEQISNWERRPLRNSQLHYAALDAYILTVLFNMLSEECINHGIDVERFKSCNKKCITMEESTWKLDREQIENPEIEQMPKHSKRSYSPETHSCMTSRVVPSKVLREHKPEKVPTFITDYMMTSLNAILNHLNFSTIHINKQDLNQNIEDLLNTDNCVLLTKDFKIFKKYGSNNCIFFNSRHESPAHQQFNDTMKVLNLAIRVDQSIISSIAKI